VPVKLELKFGESAMQRFVLVGLLFVLSSTSFAIGQAQQVTIPGYNDQNQELLTNPLKPSDVRKPGLNSATDSSKMVVPLKPAGAPPQQNLYRPPSL
jgi:hypothetical protein